MVFLPVWIQDEDGGSPFNRVALYQRLIFVEVNLKRNEITFDGETDIGIGIGNSCQLLAPNSEIVIKIHQDKLLFFLRFCSRRC